MIHISSVFTSLIRASPAAITILAIQKALFSILLARFSIQTPTDYLLHSLLSLNIIFQFLFYFFIYFFTSLFHFLTSPSDFLGVFVLAGVKAK